jgi:hypothetical protein
LKYASRPPQTNSFRELRNEGHQLFTNGDCRSSEPLTYNAAASDRNATQEHAAAEPNERGYLGE